MSLRPPIERQIVALAMNRIPPRDICVNLNLEPDFVYAAIRKARKDGFEIPNFPGGGGRPSASDETAVALDADVFAKVKAAARRRRITPRHLIIRLVETAVDDGLVDAILDDGEAIQ